MKVFVLFQDNGDQDENGIVGIYETPGAAMKSVPVVGSERWLQVYGQERYYLEGSCRFENCLVAPYEVQA